MTNKKHSNQTVCVAMSGGVDSAVAAALLVEQGFRVIGAFMKNWSLNQQGVSYQPWENEANVAKAVCEKLKIPFHIFDFEKEYLSRVVQSFVQDYARGLTPNPDVLCNREIKFDLFIKEAQKLGADLIATGHYAQIKPVEGRLGLFAGADSNKDQSYFLYTLGQPELKFTLFPIGHLTKPEVRKIAADLNLPNAAKKDSQGVCFIGPVSMRQFLQHYLKPQSGEVVDQNGRVIGHHDGVIYYTEGQRHGFSTGGNHEPLYIARKYIKKNQLVVVPANDPMLYCQSVNLIDCSWVDQPIPDQTKCLVRIRYRQPLQPAIVSVNDGKYQIDFENPIEFVSAGQSAVIYLGEQVLGGGIIA
ncbi:MAG: tRNA 2-thiouridine(34) synthase MnmA [Patescibacteria group bacterium]|jgi:tRNA-specific 2-thiouridylase